MGLVLKAYEPLFGNSVNFNGYHDGACVNLVGFFLVLKLAFFFQFTHSHESEVHKAYELVVSALKNLFSGIKVALVGGLDGSLVVTIFEGYVLKLGRESGMSAVIRPVSIENANLGHGRVSVFFFLEVVLNM